MLILTETDLRKIGINWHQTIEVIQNAVELLAQNDFAQPIKPYLRYRNLNNRIISMPAFIGGDYNVAGIKWIASFPDNIKEGIPRAHSVVILNDADTGKPMGIITTVLLSIIRTASVSGLMLKYFNNSRTLSKVKVGITGWGPIGQYHAKMCQAVLGDQLAEICIYDLNPIDPATLSGYGSCEMVVAGSWEEAYTDADIFMTCTVSDAPYIDQAPKPGSLHLNVSLRDYKPETHTFFKGAIIVDDWEEVCRENTDIEQMALQEGLQEKDTQSIIDIVKAGNLSQYESQKAIMFNPMGMGVFDIALGKYYLGEAREKDFGIAIESTIGAAIS